MVGKIKKKIENLKKQDEELSTLPPIEKEQKIFSKGEKSLKKLSFTTRVRLNLSNFIRCHKKELKDIDKGMKKG